MKLDEAVAQNITRKRQIINPNTIKEMNNRRPTNTLNSDIFEDSSSETSTKQTEQPSESLFSSYKIKHPVTNMNNNYNSTKSINTNPYSSYFEGFGNHNADIDTEFANSRLSENERTKKIIENRTPSTVNGEIFNYPRVSEPKFYPPANFLVDAVDPQAPLKWKQWLEEYENYSVGSRISEIIDSQRRITYLLNAAGPKVLHTYNAIKEPGDNLNDMIKKLNSHFQPPITPSFHRMKFKKEKWLDHESVDDYVNRLKNIAALGCFFSNTERDNIIRDMIIEHCTDDQLCFDLYQLLTTNTEAKLVNVVLMARNYALIKQQVSGKDRKLLTNNIMEQNINVNEINKLQQMTKISCSKCGRTHDINACPAARDKCRRCNKPGHFEKQCFTNLDRMNATNNYPRFNNYANNSAVYRNNNYNSKYEKQTNKNDVRSDRRSNESHRRSKSNQRKEIKDENRSTSSKKHNRSSSTSSTEKERRRKYKEDKKKRKEINNNLELDKIKAHKVFQIMINRDAYSEMTYNDFEIHTAPVCTVAVTVCSVQLHIYNPKTETMV